MIEIILAISLPLIKFFINIVLINRAVKKNNNAIRGFLMSLGIGFGFMLVSTILIMFFVDLLLLKFVIYLFISYIVFMILEILFFLRKNKFVNLQR